MRWMILGAMAFALLMAACDSSSDSPEPQGGEAGAGGAGGFDGGAGAPGGGGGGEGGEGGSEGEGGAGGSVPVRAELCGSIAAKWERCGADTTGMVEACIADAGMSDERTAICAECVDFAVCRQLNDFACEQMCTPPTANLLVRAEGFVGFEGRTVYLDALDAEGASVSGGSLAELDGTGAFSYELWGLREGMSLEIRLWADLDGDGLCGTAADHHATLRVEALRDQDEVVFFPELPDDPTICEGFDWVPASVEFSLTGLAGVPDGAAAVVALRHFVGDQEFDIFSETIEVSGGAFSAFFPGMVEGGAPCIVRWFVDADGSGTCDATDPAGSHAFTAEAGTTKVQATPTQEAPLCSIYWGWGYTIGFEGGGFDSLSGQGMVGHLLERTSGELLATSWGYVDGGQLVLEFFEAAPGGFELELLYHFDEDFSGSCEPGEVVGRVAVGVVSEAKTFSVDPPGPDESGICDAINAMLAP